MEVEHQPTQQQEASGPAFPDHLLKELGRDTPAGKALFKLYGGDKARTNVGNKYDEANRRKHEAKLATGWTPQPKVKPPPPPKPTINYPSFGRHKFEMPAPVEFVPRRRPAAVILKEIKEELERSRHLKPPPKGPLLDDTEKERFAMYMRYRGKPPVATKEELEECKRHRGQTIKRTGLAELQHMFEQVALEVEERRNFLEDMEKQGALDRETHHMVRAEIQQRVKDLEKLDNLINDYGKP